MAPSGLIPQALIYTKSLIVTSTLACQSQNAPGPVHSSDGNSSLPTEDSIVNRDFDPPSLPANYIDEVPAAVVEQRVSNLAQGSLCLVLLTGPFLQCDKGTTVVVLKIQINREELTMRKNEI